MTMSTINQPRAQQAMAEPTTRVSVSDHDVLDVWVMGAGEPVVLVHGAMTRDLLVPLAHELTDNGDHQVIHYGRRGHGGHGLPAEATDIAGQAGDVVTILDALGIEKAHVAGHSLGAYIALEAATRAHDRLLSAILFEPLFPQAWSEASQQEMRKISDEALPMIAEMYMSGEADRAVTAFCDITSGVEGAIDLIEPVLPKGARELAAADLDTFFRVDGPAMVSWTVDPATVKEVPTPILWVNGADSPAAFYESRDFLRELLPGTTAVQVAGAGHYFPVLKFAETATAVAEWLRSQPTADRATVTAN
jgi:3-oxoadipate enol-lactonase